MGKGALLAQRLNTQVVGHGPRTFLCVHGFCSAQTAFRHQTPVLARVGRVVSYDLAGFGQADPDVWHPQRHASLESYAEDLVALLDELDLRRVTLLGASMGAMIGVLAAQRRPERFEGLVFIGASPRYLDDGAYRGGFSEEQIEAFYHLIERGQDWRGALGHMMLGQSVSLALQEVAENVRGVRPEVAGVVARAIFGSDYRTLLAQVRHPVLITQTRADSVVPEAVGRYLQRQLPHAQLVFLPGVGHLPNFTEPEAFNEVLEAFLLALPPGPVQPALLTRPTSPPAC
ncbi:alpha/beta fold hydrolase [Deinococcus hohokamensis]|uniref:Alpha/beta fold hydrolase n=1 Tax=Deinococcus hohokamensis TaxID=309883 RepID=A0ABV9I7X7_9DEIO